TDSIARRAIVTLRDDVTGAGASIEVAPLPVVRARELDLLELFRRLLANAIEYRDSRAPEVRIAAARHGREWVFSVTDNGIGIRPDATEAVFDVFFRLHTREAYPGSGV